MPHRQHVEVIYPSISGGMSKALYEVCGHTLVAPNLGSPATAGGSRHGSCS